MKVKIVKSLSGKEVGMVINLTEGQIINLDDAFAKELVDTGIAEYEI